MNFRSVQDLLDAFYGGSFVTQPVESTYTIGAAAVPIGAKINGVRTSVVVSNSSTAGQILTVSFNPAMTVVDGIKLLTGTNYRFDWYYDGDLVSRQLYAIASGAGGKLYVLERFITGA